jgi:UDP-N-acetylglucosamine transferase subunit ALG13
MILVTVGVSNLPFDRLVAAVDGLAAEGETVVAQYGAARTRPQRAVCFDYLPFVELQEWVSKARVVVCHAGIGSVAMCLSTGMHPVVVPRVKRLGESVDGHQLTFGRRLGELGLATVVEDVSELARVVRSVPPHQPRTGLSRELADELLEYIGSVRARREDYESG